MFTSTSVKNCHLSWIFLSYSATFSACTCTWESRENKFKSVWTFSLLFYNCCCSLPYLLFGIIFKVLSNWTFQKYYMHYLLWKMLWLGIICILQFYYNSSYRSPKALEIIVQVLEIHKQKVPCSMNLLPLNFYLLIYFLGNCFKYWNAHNSTDVLFWQ